MRRDVLLLLLAFAFQDSPDTRTVDLPTIKVVEGPLQIWRPGQPDPVAAENEVRVAPTDRLGTAKGQLAILMAGSGSMITLKGVRVAKDAGLSFEKVESKLVMRVYDGKVAIDAFAAEFTVQTPQGSVDGGSSYFLIEVNDKATKVVVLDGKLRFTDSQGGVTTVVTGEQVVAETGKKAAAPKRADPGEGAWLAPTANLAKNGNFDGETRSWDFYDRPPDTNKYTFDTKVFNSAKPSLTFPVNLQLMMGEEMILFHQVVTVVPKKRYLLRAYVRTEMTQGRFQPGIHAEPVVDGATSRSFLRAFPPSDDGAWKMARLFIVAKEAKLKIGGTAQLVDPTLTHIGKVWFDDFTLVEVPEVTEAKSR